jgi:hypothetical protein
LHRRPGLRDRTQERVRPLHPGYALERTLDCTPSVRQTNSLLTGKISGNFEKFGLVLDISRAVDIKYSSHLKSLRQIPCSARNREIFFHRTGNASAPNRE